MFKIKNTISVAALVCGLFIVFAAAPQKISAQFVPPGSYQKSCEDISTSGSTLKASCGRKSDTASKLGGGKKFPTSSSLTDYFECEGSIWNDDGELKCNRNPNSALMQKAKSAILAGHKNVVGVGLPDNAYNKFLQLLFADGMAQKFYDGSLGGVANLGLIPWFQNWLSRPENAKTKSVVIRLAFFEVYNYEASPKDFAFYNSNATTGFQTIVLAEQKKLNADKVIRRLMIGTAYKYTMGRNPTDAEFGYWLPRTEYFSQIVEANRAFLYGGSVKGSSDLAETVKRALNKNGTNPKPEIDQINKAITKYSVNRAIYDEMN